MRCRDRAVLRYPKVGDRTDDRVAPTGGRASLRSDRRW